MVITVKKKLRLLSIWGFRTSHPQSVPLLYADHFEVKATLATLAAGSRETSASTFPS